MVKKLESAYVQWQNDPSQPVAVDSPAVEFFQSKEVRATHGYADAFAHIVEIVKFKMQDFPVIRDRMLDMVTQEYKPEETVLQTTPKDEDLSPYGEDWAMADRVPGGAHAQDREVRPVR